MIHIGTAGWALPRPFRERFTGSGSNLTRYSGVFSATEINSSFYRLHLPKTYARWAASVPEPFRFSVKLPRTITHERRLERADEKLDAFLDAVGALGISLGCLLVQLPPSFVFAPSTMEAFLVALRERYAGHVAIEPRHPTWFDPESLALLTQYRCAQVAADPARVPAAAEARGWTGFEYWRLHGSPRVYFSSYADGYLDALATKLLGAHERGKIV